MHLVSPIPLQPSYTAKLVNSPNADGPQKGFKRKERFDIKQIDSKEAVDESL